MKIISDIFAFTSRICRNSTAFQFRVITWEAGATADIELAYTLANGLEYIRTGLEAGMDIDNFAPRLSFLNWNESFYGNRQNESCAHLWAKIVNQFNPKNQKSWRCVRTVKQAVGV